MPVIQHWGGRGGRIIEFKASLSYILKSYLNKPKSPKKSKENKK
jgi:hypothetical protein